MYDTEENFVSQSNPIQPDAKPTHWESRTRILVAFFLVVGLVFALSLLSPIFELLAVGFISAFILFYPVKGLARWLRGRYSLALVIVFLLVGVLAVVLTLTGAGKLIAEAQSLGTALGQVNIPLLKTLTSFLPSSVTDQMSSLFSFLAGVIASSVKSFMSTISILFMGLVIGFLLMLNMHGGRGQLIIWVPQALRTEITLLLASMDQMWVRYMLVQVIYGSCIAAGSFLIFILVGAPAPLPMALAAGVLSIVPIIGGVLASLVIAIPCLALGSTKLTSFSNLQFALFVLLLHMLMTQAVYYGIGLPLTGKMVKLPVVVVMLGAMLGLSTGNFMIAFLAVPVISTVKVIGSYLLAKALDMDENPSQGFQLDKDPGFFSQLMFPPEEKAQAARSSK